jgi:hypothetical protein
MLNAVCAWMVFFEEDCANVGQNFCNAVRPLHLLWLPLLAGLVMMIPVSVPLGLAAHFGTRLTSASYFVGALIWTLLFVEIYVRDGFSPDGHGCENCMLIVLQLILNWVWLPIGLVIFLIEMSLRKQQA